jgi:hypothetical protein
MKILFHWFVREIRSWLTALGWRRTATVIALGLAAQQIWFWEIILIKGWAGLQWTGPPYMGVGLMTILIATALMVAASADEHFPSDTPRRLAFIFLTSLLLSLILLATAIVLMLGLNPRTFVLLCVDSVIACIIMNLIVFPGALAALVFATGMTIRSLLHEFAAAITIHPFRNIVLALLLMPPAAIVTIQVFPAISGSRDYIHAVKMGYPAFWSVVLLAMAVARSRRGTTPT